MGKGLGLAVYTMLRVSPVLDLVIKEEKDGEGSYEDQREMDQETVGRGTRGRRQKLEQW